MHLHPAVTVTPCPPFSNYFLSFSPSFYCSPTSLTPPGSSFHLFRSSFGIWQGHDHDRVGATPHPLVRGACSLVPNWSIISRTVASATLRTASPSNASSIDQLLRIGPSSWLQYLQESEPAIIRQCRPDSLAFIPSTSQLVSTVHTFQWTKKDQGPCNIVCCLDEGMSEVLFQGRSLLYSFRFGTGSDKYQLIVYQTRHILRIIRWSVFLVSTYFLAPVAAVMSVS